MKQSFPLTFNIKICVYPAAGHGLIISSLSQIILLVHTQEYPDTHS